MGSCRGCAARDPFGHTYIVRTYIHTHTHTHTYIHLRRCARWRSVRTRVRIARRPRGCPTLARCAMACMSRQAAMASQPSRPTRLGGSQPRLHLQVVGGMRRRPTHCSPQRAFSRGSSRDPVQLHGGWRQLKWTSAHHWANRLGRCPQMRPKLPTTATLPSSPRHGRCGTWCGTPPRRSRDGEIVLTPHTPHGWGRAVTQMVMAIHLFDLFGRQEGPASSLIMTLIFYRKAAALRQ